MTQWIHLLKNSFGPRKQRRDEHRREEIFLEKTFYCVQLSPWMLVLRMFLLLLMNGFWFTFRDALGMQWMASRWCQRQLVTVESADCPRLPQLGPLATDQRLGLRCWFDGKLDVEMYFILFIWKMGNWKIHSYCLKLAEHTFHKYFYTFSKYLSKASFRPGQEKQKKPARR